MKWAYIATFNGRRVDKCVVSSEFFLGNVQWNTSRQKFAFTHKEEGYTEGIILFEAKNLETVYDNINKKLPCCRPNTFSPFPDKSIMREVHFSDIQTQYELEIRKCQLLQAENDFLKQHVAWLLASLERYNYLPSGPNMGENNNLEHKSIYGVELKKKNIAIKEQFVQPLATHSKCYII